MINRQDREVFKQKLINEKDKCYVQIINMNDEIENNINKIKFIIYDINDSNNKIVIKRRFTEIINQPIILANNNIILYLFTQDNYVLCNYKFIN